MSSDFSYHSLLDKFKKTKKELGDAEKTIRRITGRDPDEFSNLTPGTSKFRVGPSASGRTPFSGRKRLASFSARKQPKEKESSFEEDSVPEDDDDEPTDKKPTLQSTVVAKSNEERSRRATIEKQNVNSKIKARNRRMFGALIGTLEKFQHEEKKRQHQESMRAEIEQKVEAATEEEREKIKKEKELLFVTRREKQTQLRCLEKKLERAESYEVYDANHHHLKNFIRTKAEPPIFFLPSSHTTKSKKRLEESKNKIQELRKSRKECLEKDLVEIEEWYKKDHAIPDKENKSPKEGGETHDMAESEPESLMLDAEVITPDEEDSSKSKNVESLADQDFEPIYD